MKVRSMSNQRRLTSPHSTMLLMAWKEIGGVNVEDVMEGDIDVEDATDGVEGTDDELVETDGVEDEVDAFGGFQ